jgi:3-deoxy-manno-octulosonate cytidylyltransferase (CMP-KDO synthetase)
MRVAAVIPARYGSTRFPGKPLAMLCGKPMIRHVYENAARCDLLQDVIVATDSDEIARCVAGFGGTVRMTSPAHATGTDRIAEVARYLEADLIVNVQGDEPLLPAAAISEAVTPLLQDPGIPMGTLKTAIRQASDTADPNVVKVVTDRHDFALYFSRLPLPFVRLPARAPVTYYRHIGVYVYRKEFLMTFAGLEQTPLEQAEALEQLRALEHGYAVKASTTAYCAAGVDVPEDVAQVEALLAAMPRGVAGR